LAVIQSDAFLSLLPARGVLGWFLLSCSICQGPPLSYSRCSPISFPCRSTIFRFFFLMCLFGYGLRWLSEINPLRFPSSPFLGRMVVGIIFSQAKGYFLARGFAIPRTPFPRYFAISVPCNLSATRTFFFLPMCVFDFCPLRTALPEKESLLPRE